ncbi:MAG: peptide-methionine (S)-S-oxide reductase MsrA [Gammaproteobacteria bacterium]|jgi:peptide-methionine (S)-S-oxide reductase
MSNTTQKATFAAGCFWGVEETFAQTPGVISTRVGYTGGHTENPNYPQVCSDTTGHAEAVEITFDPNIVSYEKLLDIFWHKHNPTLLNRQGPDVGSQYRSVIFYHNEMQKQLAEQSKKNLEQAHVFAKPIVTEIVPAVTFYPAEEYHQKYLQKQGRSSCQF